MGSLRHRLALLVELLGFRVLHPLQIGLQLRRFLYPLHLPHVFAPTAAPLMLTTPTIFRGGQPRPQAYAEMKKIGVEIVVNFRDESSEIEKERKAVEALGMRYVSIPWSASDRPFNQQVAQFLELVRAHPEQKFFVHCRFGSDRTGVMIAAYRIAVERWTPEKAVQEMGTYHYHRFFYPHLKDYVDGFPRQLAEDPRLRAFVDH